MKKEMLKTREPKDEGEMETVRWFSPLTSQELLPLTGKT
jgi:hypothetical protein